MQNTIAKDMLREYVMRNEVVFQAFGDLVEVANEAEKENRCCIVPNSRINLPTPSNRCQNHHLPQGYPGLLELFQGSQPAGIHRSNSDKSLHTSNPRSSAYGNDRICGEKSHHTHRISNRDYLSSSDVQPNGQPTISASRHQGKRTALVANGQNETSTRIHVPSVALSYHRVDSKTCSTPYDTPKRTTYALHAMYNASPQSQYRESA